MGDNAVDKVDMSLDDIIKQNRKEKRAAARQDRNKKVTKLIGKPGARAALAFKAARGRGRGARGVGTPSRGAGRGARRGGAVGRGAVGRGGRGRGRGAMVGRQNRQGGTQQQSPAVNRQQNQRSQLNNLRRQKLQQARARLQQQQQKQQQNRQNRQFGNRGLQQPQQQRGGGGRRGRGRGQRNQFQLNRRGAFQGQGNRQQQQQQQQQQNRRKWNNTPRGPPPTHILTVSVPNPLANKAAPSSPQKNQSFSRGFNNAASRGGFKTLSDRFSAAQQTPSYRGQQSRGRGRGGGRGRGRGRGRGGGRGRGRGGAMGRMVTLH